MSTTGIVRDDFYIKHNMGSFHPECPERLEVIYQMIDDLDINDQLKKTYPREATEDEITAIHTPEYYRRVADTANRTGITSLDPDTSACPDTFQAAKLAAGGLLSLVEAVQEKILIVDWDLHHGNATQHSFYDNPQVLYFSTHQYPYYPGTGSFEEIGDGKGKGYTVNVPLQPGAGDDEYIMIFQKILQPLAREFNPEFILVSAGFDIYYQDPLGGMQVTPEGFASLTRILLDSAQELCQGKLAMTLEGGYSLEGLRDSVKRVLRELAGESISELKMQKSSGIIDSVIERVKENHKEYWHCFSSWILKNNNAHRY